MVLPLLLQIEVRGHVADGLNQERDDEEAIDPGNIIKDKSRIGKPGRTLGRYAEPTDEDYGLME